MDGSCLKFLYTNEILISVKSRSFKLGAFHELYSLVLNFCFLTIKLTQQKASFYIKYTAYRYIKVYSVRFGSFLDYLCEYCPEERISNTKERENNKTFYVHGTVHPYNIAYVNNQRDATFVYYS